MFSIPLDTIYRVGSFFSKVLKIVFHVALFDVQGYSVLVEMGTYVIILSFYLDMLVKVWEAVSFLISRYKFVWDARLLCPLILYQI